MNIKVTLTLEQIYQVVCPQCREKILTLAAQKTEVDQVKAALKSQLESKHD